MFETLIEIANTICKVRIFVIRKLSVVYSLLFFELLKYSSISQIISRIFWATTVSGSQKHENILNFTTSAIFKWSISPNLSYLYLSRWNSKIPSARSCSFSEFALVMLLTLQLLILLYNSFYFSNFIMNFTFFKFL